MRIFGLGSARSPLTLENMSLTQLIRGFSSAQVIERTLTENPRFLNPRSFGKREVKKLGVDSFIGLRGGGSHLRYVQFNNDPVVCAVSEDSFKNIYWVGMAYSSDPNIHLHMMRKITEKAADFHFMIFGGRKSDSTETVSQALSASTATKGLVNHPGPSPILSVIFDPLSRRIVYFESSAPPAEREPRKIDLIKVFAL